MTRDFDSWHVIGRDRDFDQSEIIKHLFCSSSVDDLIVMMWIRVISMADQSNPFCIITTHTRIIYLLTVNY